MKNWYNVEVQMLGECEITDELVEIVAESLGFKETDVDEREIYKLTAVFSSDDPPTVIHNAIEILLDDRPEIFYIDLLYRVSNEMEPRRVTFWQGGKIQTYKTRVIYEEEE